MYDLNGPGIADGSTGIQRIEKSIKRLPVHTHQSDGGRAEIYRLLSELRNWEMKRAPMPTVLCTTVVNDDDQPSEHIDLTIGEDAIDVEEFIITVLLIKVITADPDNSFEAVKSKDGEL